MADLTMEHIVCVEADHWSHVVSIIVFTIFYQQKWCVTQYDCRSKQREWSDQSQQTSKYQWEFQDPKMEVRSYHIFGHILGVYPLNHSPEK